MSFVGRKAELNLLEEIYSRPTFGLVTVQGRRRIGKSSLIHFFAKKTNRRLYEFQGLAPRLGQSNKDQLEHFAKTLSKYLGIKAIQFSDWSEALEQLGRLPQSEKILILLDEISWLGGKDSDFPGKLKNLCDKLTRENPNILLILCGSVSSWIQKNILNNTGFVGRISSEIFLKELSLIDSKKLLLEKNRKIKNAEIIKFLSMTGGVPKYIEEVNPKESPEVNIDLFFMNPNGFFFQEFETIFSDIFGKRNDLYNKILLQLNKKTMAAGEIAEKLGLPLNGDTIEYLTDLEQSGFIKKFNSWNFKGGPSKNYRYRIIDNYTRFYLKYVFPRKERIQTLPSQQNSKGLIQWPIVFGLQLENLIMNNLPCLIRLLKIDIDDIENLGPYFQTQTKMKEGVQIDLLIQCKRGILHVCEIKSGTFVDSSVIDEVKKKNKNLKKPKGFTVLNHLICLGQVAGTVVESDFFDRIVVIDQLLDSDEFELSSRF
ncbi:MAG: ATP-binding protein [Bdellovibrionales bacterium]|nr:ATP-binding protein [Bdellovibrionales bacterium]